MKPRHAFVLSSLVLAAAACIRPITGCTCSPPPDAAVLVGTVKDPDGAPLAGATVRAEHGAPGCVEPLNSIGDPGAGVSAADGTFRLTLYAWGPMRPGDCLRAVATPPQGSGLASSPPVPFAVRFGPATLPADTARVDLVLARP